MKKNLKILSATLVAALMTLSACGPKQQQSSSSQPATTDTGSTGSTGSESTGSTSTTDTGATTGSESTGSSESSTSETSTSQEATKLATPVLVMGDYGIEWAAVAGAEHYEAKLGADGEYMEIDMVPYEVFDAAGSYTIYVKAVGNGTTTADSDAASITVEVKNCSVKFTRTGKAAVSWVAVGAKIELSVNESDFEVTTATSYEGSAGDKVEIKASSGVDKEHNTVYIGIAIEEYSFLEEASEAVQVEKVGDKTAEDLADDWSIQKWDTSANSWASTTATIGTTAHYDGTNKVIKFGCWNNQIIFKYSRAMSIDKAVNELDFLVKGDGYANVKIQLANSESGVYMTYDLGIIGNAWYNQAIKMNDAGWKINFGGNTYTFDQVKNYVDMYDETELAAYFDTFNVILTGNNGGKVADVYMDDIKFANTAASSTHAEQPLFNKKSYYFAKVGEHTVELDLAAGKVSYDGAEIAVSNLGVNVVDLQTADGGATLSIGGLYKANGAQIEITSIDGTVGSTLTALVGVVLTAGANLNYAFPKWSSDGANYTGDSDWSLQTYTSSGWTDGKASDNMRCKIANDSEHVVNFYSDSSARIYKYAPQGGIGLANYVSIRYGTYFGALKLKLRANLTNGNQVYLTANGANEWVSLPQVGANSTGNRTLSDLGVEVDGLDIKSLDIVLQSSSSSYFYVAGFKALAIAPTPEPEPELERVDSILENFEDGTVGSAYSNSKWKCEKTTDGTNWVSGGSMNCRSKGDSKAVNVVLSKGGVFRYTYTFGTILNKANKFGVKVWNDFSSNTDLDVIIYVTKTDGTIYNIMGDASTQDFAQIPAGISAFDVDQDIDETSDIVSLSIVGKQSAIDNAYLYIDNLSLSYVS